MSIEETDGWYVWMDTRRKQFIDERAIMKDFYWEVKDAWLAGFEKGKEFMDER